MIITSNRDVAEWPPLFDDALSVGGLFESLLFQAYASSR